MDITASASAAVGITQSQFTTQVAIASLKEQAETQQKVASKIIGASINAQTFNSNGVVVTPPGQIFQQSA